MERMMENLKKYRWALGVLLLGICLMLLPESGEPQDETPVPDSSAGIEERLEDILSRMDGVGRAQVLLTQAQGEQVLYEYSEDSTQSDATRSVHKEPVTVTDADRNEAGLIRQTLPPTYLGAIVVCDGGGNPSVRLAVVEAVGAVTGLTSDRITVAKMK